MQDRRVAALGIVMALDLPGAQRQLDAAQQCRVRIVLEVGIDQVRQLAGAAVELDEVGPLDLAQVSPAAAFVDPQQRPQ
jgi:hypothetical protein